MDESVELRMSLGSIKRVDPYVKEILATATHVTLYKFDTSKNEWEKTETEGGLFIYSRNGEPHHSFMVMNRLNTNNQIEPIVKDFDHQMQVPFLLYRNSSNKIFGIWFFNKEECVKITYLLELIMENLKQNSTEQITRKQNGVDIFSMLSKAQQDFNKTPTKQDTIEPPFASTPRLADIASHSVKDFFAKAGSKSTQKPINPAGNVLQRIMSNPAHSVEHIEKQQRSITPQESRQRTPVCGEKPTAPIPIPLQTNKRTIQESNLCSSLGLLPINSTPLAPRLHDESDTVLGTSPLNQFVENHKPLLMTPMMLTTPLSWKDKPEASAGQPNLAEDGLNTDTLLTEKQLAQALIHLLKNNSEFIRVIHEAYVNSIMEKVKTPSFS